MANFVGAPLEFAVRSLPAAVSSRIHGAVEAALHKSAQAALWSLADTPGFSRDTRKNAPQNSNNSFVVMT